MDLKEASLVMCHLLMHEKDVKDACEAAKKNSADGVLDPNIEAEFKERIREATINIAEFGNRLAAIPAFFDIMESWLVTAMGRQGVSEESMQEAMKTNDRDTMIERTGALAASVRDYLRSQGFIIRDMGAGEDGWDMCVRCSEKKSRTLCFDLHQRFADAIRLKLMHVSRRFGGHYLPGIYTWRDAQKLLKGFGDGHNDQGEIDD